ncbi:MAG: hypothetical protein VB139_03500, partial [Coriobacteriia bacterium]|nr:hypothetical protein [Coriobacteriia bacterium]
MPQFPLVTVRGTNDWQRIMRMVDVPATATTMVMVLRHFAGGGTAYFDAVSVMPDTQTTSTLYDPSHTYAVKSTGTNQVGATAVTDHLGQVTATGVVPRGSAAETALGSAVYDSLGRLASATSAPDSDLGITATFAYTDAGRLSRVSGPLGSTTEFDYDGAGRLAGSTSATGITTRVGYDGLGRVASTFVPARSALPTLTASTTAYDRLGRLAQTTFKTGSGATFATVTQSYDDASRLTSITRTGAGPASAALTYDALSRITRQVSTGPAGTVTIDAGYNAADQPTELTVGALGASWTTSASYAKTHQPVSMSALGQTWRFGYSAPGALTQIASERALRTRSYDTAGRLAAVSGGYSTGAAYFTNLLRSDLAYDSRDRIAEVHTAIPGSVYADTFSYDAASRLAGF